MCWCKYCKIRPSPHKLCIAEMRMEVEVAVAVEATEVEEGVGDMTEEVVEMTEEVVVMMEAVIAMHQSKLWLSM